MNTKYTSQSAPATFLILSVATLFASILIITMASASVRKESQKHIGTPDAPVIQTLPTQPD